MSGSIRSPISCAQMSQIGRTETDRPLGTGHASGVNSADLADVRQRVIMTRGRPCRAAVIRTSNFCVTIYLGAPVDAIGVALCKVTIGIVMDDDTVKHDVVRTASVIRVVGEKYESMT